VEDPPRATWEEVRRVNGHHPHHCPAQQADYGGAAGRRTQLRFLDRALQCSLRARCVESAGAWLARRHVSLRSSSLAVTPPAVSASRSHPSPPQSSVPSRADMELESARSGIPAYGDPEHDWLEQSERPKYDLPRRSYSICPAGGNAALPGPARATGGTPRLRADAPAIGRGRSVLTFRAVVTSEACPVSAGLLARRCRLGTRRPPATQTASRCCTPAPSAAGSGRGA
jgi:hypothetical protein